MTMTTTTFDLGGRIATPARLDDLTAALRAGWQEWRRRSAERRGLRAVARLDARLIRDMGLDPDVVRGLSGDPLPFGLAILISRGSA
jgi:uncharacterized protein YjiS (DUF1127 family)